MRTIAYWLSLFFIFTIPWETVVEHATLGSMSRLVGFALAGVWLGAVLVSGKMRQLTTFHLVFLVFFLWYAASVFWSAKPDRSLNHAITWIQLLLVSIIIWDLFRVKKNFLYGLQMYLLGAYVVLGNTLINYFSGTSFYYERFSAAGTNPDDLGATMALAIPIAWFLAYPINAKKIHPVFRWVNYAYIPAALMGIALSGTRTALIAAAPGMMFGLATLTRLRLWPRVVIFGLLVVAAIAIQPLIPQSSYQRLGTTGSELAAGDFNGRRSLWVQGLASFQEHPILGVGGNMYRYVNNEGKVAHNSFISVLVEVGLVGFGLFLVILVVIFNQIYPHFRWEKYFWYSILAAWLVAASTLTWEYRKPTWLVFNLLVVSAGLARHRIALYNAEQAARLRLAAPAGTGSFSREGISSD